MTMKAALNQNDLWKARRPKAKCHFRESRVCAMSADHSLTDKEFKTFQALGNPSVGFKGAKDMSIKERGSPVASLAAG